MVAVDIAVAAAVGIDYNRRPDMNPALAIMVEDMCLYLQEMKLAEEHIRNHTKLHSGIVSNGYKDRS